MDKSEVLGRLVHTEHTIRSQASKRMKDTWKSTRVRSDWLEIFE